MNDKDNKLIALFMGLKPHHQDAGYLIDESKDEGYEAIHESCFLYGSSWDWLMPVLVKIEKIEIGGGTWTSVYFDIEREHKKAVEFIKEYNNEK